MKFIAVLHSYVVDSIRAYEWNTAPCCLWQAARPRAGARGPDVRLLHVQPGLHNALRPHQAREESHGGETLQVGAGVLQVIGSTLYSYRKIHIERAGNLMTMGWVIGSPCLLPVLEKYGIQIMNFLRPYATI